VRILALETSSLSGSVAALEDDQLLGQTAFDPDQRTAQSFAPAIRDQLDAVGWRPRDIQLVAVTRGPGSFTGLRVGVTAAKTLAYAVSAHVVGLDTLRVIAWQAKEAADHICAVLNAQRQQVFVARFQHIDQEWTTVTPTSIVDNEAFLASLDARVSVTGTGLARLRDRLPDGVHAVDPSLWAPQAATVGILGYHDTQSGRRDDLWKLTPEYFRKSAAEEKLEG
jgi:tRNA threonylcarbamoyladenosine biosynthesis protein TsaB